MPQALVKDNKIKNEGRIAVSNPTGKKRTQIKSSLPSNEYRGSKKLQPLSDIGGWVKKNPHLKTLFNTIRVKMDWLQEGDRLNVYRLCEVMHMLENIESKLEYIGESDFGDPCWKSYPSLRLRAKELSSERMNIMKMLNANALHRQYIETPLDTTPEKTESVVPKVKIA